MNTEDPQADIRARQAVLRAADRVAAERASAGQAAADRAAAGPRAADPEAAHSTDLLHREQEAHLLPAETTRTDHTETAEAHLPGAERRKSESVPDSIIFASWFYIPLFF